MNGNGDNPIITDGTTSFGGGVDSIKPTTIAGIQAPDGLVRNQQAWLTNATVRDGGISPRWGWQPIAKIHEGDALYQGGYMYDPIGYDPYLVLQIGGRLQIVNCLTGAVTDISGVLTNPANQPEAYFCQAEEFLVIQAGDLSTLPLFWDGSTLWRSKGITTTSPGAGTHHTNEIPAAGPMCYYMGRLWYAFDRTIAAGDIVGGASAWPAGHVPFYNGRDSVLCVQENPLCFGGDGFTVPAADGHIRAMQYLANLNTTTGEGSLYIFTPKAVYSLDVPVTRTDWIAADSTKAPKMTVAQFINGAVGERSVVAVNGDLYFQSLEPGIRSLVAAIRYFQQPGNIQISANENRILALNDRALLRYASGIAFDNRLLMTALPFSTPVGVAHKALVPLDFIPCSSFNQQYSPVWEGNYEGLDILQLFTGNFGGLERAFAIVWSKLDGGLWLWELTVGNQRENGDQRILWQAEFPAFTWGHIDKMKKLLGAELWIDHLSGTAEFELDYRVDGETCWVPWMKWKQCSARNSSERTVPTLYPETCGPGYQQTIDLPAPPTTCSQMSRPTNIGYQFQPRLTVRGYCRVRGIFLHGTEWKKKLYGNLPCRVAPRESTPPPPPAVGILGAGGDTLVGAGGDQIFGAGGD